MPDGEITPDARAAGFVSFALAAMADLDRAVPPGAKVLDFGSGDGTMVDAFLAAGYDAYGCDIELEEETERQRLIETPYRLPFPDATFDFVASAQVLEHVQDHAAAFAELHRVLKPGGASLHMFPPRWRPIEPHTYVPLATVITARPWLLLWAALGRRNEFQRDLGARVTAARNRDFLRTATNYLSRRELERTARRLFPEVEFVERLLLKHSEGRGRRFYQLACAVPALERAYGAVRERLMLLAK